MAFLLEPLTALLLGGGFLAGPWNASQTSFDARALPTTSPLLSQLERQRLASDEVLQVRRLVDRLGNERFSVRESAYVELLHWKPGAEAVLRREAARTESAETRARVERILRQGLGRWSATQAEAAVRLLDREPAETATAALIAYLPFVEDAGVRGEIASALRRAAQREPAVQAALRRLRETCDPEYGPTLDAALDGAAPEPSPTLRAEAVARRFFAAMAQGDLEALRRVTTLPFSLGNGMALTSPRERDEFFRDAVANYRETSAGGTLHFQHVTRGEAFLPWATAEEADFLQRVPGHELRAVHVRLRRSPVQEENGAVLVRVGSSDVHVIGLASTGGKTTLR